MRCTIFTKIQISRAFLPYDAAAEKSAENFSLSTFHSLMLIIKVTKMPYLNIHFWLVFVIQKEDKQLIHGMNHFTDFSMHYPRSGAEQKASPNNL